MSPKTNKAKRAPEPVGVLDFHAGLAAHALIAAEGGGTRARASIRCDAAEIAALSYRMAFAMQGARLRYGLGVRDET